MKFSPLTPPLSPLPRSSRPAPWRRGDGPHLPSRLHPIAAPGPKAGSQDRQRPAHAHLSGHFRPGVLLGPASAPPRAGPGGICQAGPGIDRMDNIIHTVS